MTDFKAKGRYGIPATERYIWGKAGSKNARCKNILITPYRGTFIETKLKCILVYVRIHLYDI